MQQSGSGRQRERFIAFYQAHYESVYRYAWRRIPPDEVADVSAETFTIAWRRVDDVPVGQELPWLYGVARNVIYNERRRERRAPVLSAEPHRSTVLADHADEVSGRDAALGAIRDLNADDRELLLLVAWEGLNPTDVATTLGCSTSAVHTRLHRLRKRLDHDLNDEIPGRSRAHG